MRSGIGERVTQKDGTVDFKELCRVRNIGWDEMIYGNSFHGISKSTEPFGCDTWEDGITPKIRIHLSGCSHNGDYHLIAFDYCNGNFTNQLNDNSPSFKSLLLHLFLVAGPPPEKFKYQGRETILFMSLDINCDVYDIPSLIQHNMNPECRQVSLVRGGKSVLTTTILSSRHATEEERDKVFALYGVKDLIDHEKPKCESLFRIPTFGETTIVQSLDSDVYHRWQGLLCNDSYSPLVHFRIRQYPTDFHVLAWEKKEAIQAKTYEKLFQVTLYVAEGNNQALLRTYDDAEQILCVVILYSFRIGTDIAIHDIYSKSVSGIKLAGYNSGNKISCDTYTDVEIREVTSDERVKLKTLFPSLFSNAHTAQVDKLISSNTCSICGWVHTNDCSRWEHPHTHEVITTSKKRAKLLFDLHSGMEKDGGDTAINNFISDGDRKAGYQAGDILGDKLQTLLYFSTKRGRGRIRKPDEKAPQGRPSKKKK